VDSIQLATADGQLLEADLTTPDGATLGGVVVCHPHPGYGGNRFNNVVDALFTALPAAGFVTLRFDFRTDDGDGVAERLDVVAAIDALAARVDAPLALVGYSFGASVALNVHDDRVVAIVAIAPPLSMLPAADPGVPTLVLTPRHDQFGPPDAVVSVIAPWADCEFDAVESADHFLVGHTVAVARRASTWLAAKF
jgi:alpha/beta superfamily hydrolase